MSFFQPIPYWLYKLHGLNISYNCEICGNFVYKGPKAFQRHFAVSFYILANLLKLYPKIELDGSNVMNIEAKFHRSLLFLNAIFFSVRKF
jgi:SF3a60/Prp9 C-terminal